MKDLNRKLKLPSFRVFAGLFLLILINSGCVSKRNTNLGLRLVGGQVLKTMEARPEYKWTSGKASINFELNETKFQAKLHYRLRKDSLIWVSLSPALNIEMARTVITADSVSLINKLQKNYFRESFAAINEYLGMELDFAVLFAFFEGKPYGLDRVDRIKVRRENDLWVVSGRMKKKLLKGVKDSTKVKEKWAADLEQGVFDLNYQMNRMGEVVGGEIVEIQSGRTITLTFGSYSELNGQSFPGSMQLEAKAPDLKLKIDVKISKQRLTNSESIHFKVPSSYEKVAW